MFKIKKNSKKTKYSGDCREIFKITFQTKKTYHGDETIDPSFSATGLKFQLNHMESYEVTK